MKDLQPRSLMLPESASAMDVTRAVTGLLWEQAAQAAQAADNTGVRTGALQTTAQFDRALPEWRSMADQLITDPNSLFIQSARTTITTYNVDVPATERGGLKTDMMHIRYTTAEAILRKSQTVLPNDPEQAQPQLHVKISTLLPPSGQELRSAREATRDLIERPENKFLREGAIKKSDDLRKLADHLNDVHTLQFGVTGRMAYKETREVVTEPLAGAQVILTAGGQIETQGIEFISGSGRPTIGDKSIVSGNTSQVSRGLRQTLTGLFDRILQEAK